MSSRALIYYTHFVSDTVRSELHKLQSELDSTYTIFVIGCGPDPTFLDQLSDPRIQTCPYTREDLRSLPYLNQLANADWETLRRNPDLALMTFFRENRNFDFYWIVEYDVRYTGNWQSLLGELEGSSADLLCSHLTYFSQGPDWVHWKTFSSAGVQIDDKNKLRGFLVFCRISSKLIREIDARCQSGWTGHPEVLWPTIATHAGMSFEEIGGAGPAVPPSRKDKYYASMTSNIGVFLSTLAAWPIYSEKSDFIRNSPPDILWHPVKQ